MEIIKGKKFNAQKTMIYGMSGSGKSTLASRIGKPIFFDLEGGVEQLGVDRVRINTFEEFVLRLTELINDARGKHEYPYDTLVVDSTDWLVRKAVEQAAGIDKNHITETLNKSNGGYGNGKQVLENYIRSRLLPGLVLLNQCGYAIILIAHADRKDVLDADGLDVARITPKIDVNTMNVFVEWCDNVFYLKNTGESHKLTLTGDDNVLAKNRLGLSGEADVNEVDINKLLKGEK